MLRDTIVVNHKTGTLQTDNMFDLSYNLVLFSTLFGFSSATYYSYRIFRPHLDFGTRVHIPSSSLYTRRFTPTITNTRVFIPYTGPRYFHNNPPPANAFPVGSLYPGTGRQFPNPLDDMNTYDLPPWTPLRPVFASGARIPNDDNIIPQMPKEEVTVVFQQPLPVPTLPDNNVDFKTNSFPPWTSYSPVFVNSARIPNVPTIIPQLPTEEVIVVTQKPKPVSTTPDNDLSKDIDDKERNPTIVLPPDNDVSKDVDNKEHNPTIVLPPDNDVNKDDDDKEHNPTTVLPPIAPVVQEKGCQETGCKLGSECVYGYSLICPAHIPDLPCQCQKGCRVEHTFIPLGASTIVDTCGNICSCNSLFGGVNCSKISCQQDLKLKNNPSTSGLVLEPIPTDAPDIGPSRGDFPIASLPGQGPFDLNKNGWTFPTQNFVPPIPFLTENKNIGVFPGLLGSQIANKDNGSPVLPPRPNGQKNIIDKNIQTDAMVFPVAG